MIYKFDAKGTFIVPNPDYVYGELGVTSKTVIIGDLSNFDTLTCFGKGLTPYKASRLLPKGVIFARYRKENSYWWSKGWYFSTNFVRFDEVDVFFNKLDYRDLREWEDFEFAFTCTIQEFLMNFEDKTIIGKI